MIPSNYLEKTYAGFLGMNIGIRLGAPVEPSVWTYERIERFYGDITGYVKDFKNFAADDDANGPVYFIRALYDDAKGREMTSQDVANAWLNYTREGVGMFWWGGYGVSTEHTAYLNLKKGMLAEKSGSAQTNGWTLAEQIGGQIFIDTWGLVFPGNIEKAATYASAAARVSHDGNGVYGAAFMAACIAAAFVTSDVEEVIEAGLSQIPQDCAYAKVVQAVKDFHRENPDNFRSCLLYLKENWGYDKYPGACHIIPNAGIYVLALLYGRDFCRSIEIATMCGWDTDCNAGNVGTIMGVACGIEGILDKYRKPVNDGIVLSGISGYLNILDIPTFTKELVMLGYHLAGVSAPEELAKCVKPGEVYFDFELPGSTHNLRISDHANCSLKHSYQRAYAGKGSVEILYSGLSRGQQCKIYYKPFYRRDDFDDERYMPVFSPTAYPGQTVSMQVFTERFSGESIILNPYVRNTFTREDNVLKGIVVRSPGWNHITFTIPSMDGAVADEIGLLLESNSPAKNKDFGCLYIDDFSVSGKAQYTIDITKQSKEFASITPFSHHGGTWEIENGVMEAMCLQSAEAMTGSYYLTDVKVRGKIIPHTGMRHFISARVQGALRGYYAGFTAEGVEILCKNSDMKRLAMCPYCWEHNRAYAVELIVAGDTLTFLVDGRQLLQARDSNLCYGMVGYAILDMGRCGFGNLTVEEI